MNTKITLYVFIALLIGSSIGFATNNIINEPKIIALTDRVNSIQANYTGLQTNYSMLSMKYDELEKKYLQLKTDYDILQRYKSLNNSIILVNGTFNDPKDDIIPDYFDLKSLHLYCTQSEMIVFIQFYCDAPDAEVLIFLDINSDGKGEYYIRTFPGMAQFYKVNTQRELDFLDFLSCSYQNGVLLEIPLKLIEYPQKIGITIASYDATTNSIVDEFIPFNCSSWLTYEICKNSEIPIRGLWIDSYSPLSELFEKAKKMGVNYVQIVYWIEVRKNGTILQDSFSPIREGKQDIISLIKQAKATGFNIYLQLYPEFYGTHGAHAGELEMGPVTNQQIFMEGMKKIAIEWAKIAENYDVQLFSPSCELNIFIDWSNNMEWHEEILPELREVYHGELVQKGELAWGKYGLYPEGDLSFYEHYKGWDFVNSDIFESVNGTMSFEDYRMYLNKIIIHLRDLKEKYSIKGILFGEIGIPEGENSVISFKEVGGLSEEESTFMFAKILFEEAKNNVDGFFFWPSYLWQSHQKINVQQLIASYYHDFDESYRKDILLIIYKNEAFNTLLNAKSCTDSLSNFSKSAYERNMQEVIKAEDAYNDGEYIIAKYLANAIIYNINKLTIRPLGLIIDGYDDDWTSRYEPYIKDEIGDVTDINEDLNALYIANDQENLYFMIQFVGKPEADVVFFFDIDFDGKEDYHIRAIPGRETFLEKTIQPYSHERIAYLASLTNTVLEFKLPLNLINSQSTFNLQVGSWNDSEGISDKMLDMNWIKYTLS